MSKNNTTKSSGNKELKTVNRNVNVEPVVEQEEVKVENTEVIEAPVEPVVSSETEVGKESTVEIEEETINDETTVTPDEVKDETNEVTEVPVEPVVEQEKMESKNDITQVKKECIKVGSKVKIKKTVKTTVTGQEIPGKAYDNIYNVSKILPRRVVLTCGVFSIAVTENDIALV